MKQMEVTILGQSYILGCPDGGEGALLEAVNNVDREMCAIRDGGKIKARERIAVLAALNLAYGLAGQSAAGNSPAPELASSSAPHDPVLQALITRLDEVLAADGQLL
jgi:cell division protein ZapA